MTWTNTSLEATTVLEVADDGGWKVRILHPVVQAIEMDARLWKDKETGGALIGRISYENRTITIAGLVEAPTDSIRAPNRFTLGTDGLVSRLRQAHTDSLGYLSFIGTWHSHGSPSAGNWLGNLTGKLFRRARSSGMMSSDQQTIEKGG
ncbi:Mov34/MPN/PAD-1 family protein [Pusillimonas sp.]|uniref:Mov34/MPN/PAD-1 family protein n=1 Tax=Pusillimonas sp. TaxID=3040095 RepID=UPI0029B1AEBC|nr:Mov34/MPN/PAD-1 family protein [Pusillimonas sp.]MDX3893217.1 Mov34/MPN/PAD-1 family protein [Pusillimonas sp.]